MAEKEENPRQVPCPRTNKAGQQNPRWRLGASFARGTIVAASLSGCTTYELRVETPQPFDLGVAIAPADKIPQAFKHSKPYLYVFAAMAKTKDPSVTPCADKWVYAALRKRVQSMSVSMNIGANGNATNLKVPLYTVSSGGTNGCMVAYDHMYVFPRAPVANDARYAFPIDVLYENTSTENISSYISAGLNLAKAVAPSAVPVVTGIEAIAGSPPAQSLITLVNTSLSSRTSVQQDLESIEVNKATYNDRDVAYAVQAYPFTASYQPTGDKPIPLASLVLSVRWRHSALADEDKTGLAFNPAMSMSSTAWVFPPKSGQGQQMTIGAYIASIDNTVGALVENLQPSDTYVSAKRICDKFRQTVSAFNDLDQAALLWLAYNNSPLALASHKHANGQTNSCMSKTEIAALISLGLPPPSSSDAPAAAPGTPAPTPPAVPVTQPQAQTGRSGPQLAFR